MPVHPLDWDDLRTFLTIARHRTLSAAARALGVQQPTMGRRLEALEQRAGARLSQKTPHGFTLTEAGEAVLGNVERIEMEALAVQRRIAGQDLKLEGTIRLTTVETIALEILAPVLANFRRAHPLAGIEVIAATRSLNLTRREADVALRMARFTQPDLVVRKATPANKCVSVPAKLPPKQKLRACSTRPIDSIIVEQALRWGRSPSASTRRRPGSNTTGRSIPRAGARGNR